MLKKILYINTNHEYKLWNSTLYNVFKEAAKEVSGGKKQIWRG